MGLISPPFMFGGNGIYGDMHAKNDVRSPKVETLGTGHDSRFLSIPVPRVIHKFCLIFDLF